MIVKRYVAILFVALTMAFVTSCQDDVKSTETNYSETTQELVDMVESTPQLKALLEEAIAKAKQQNPDKSTNPAQSLKEYYDFIDFSLTAMPWDVMICPGQPTIGGRMNQALCYCYYINTMPLESLEDENFFTASVQYVEPYRSWLIKYCKAWGEFLSTPESWNKEYEALVMQQPELGMDWYEDPSNWKSFNDFFCRHLKSPDKRPIASPEDDSVVASPADCVPQGVWDIDEESYIVTDDSNGVTLKSREFNSIRNLIGPESPYCDAFAGGKFYHAFLDVFDYHRYHFPVGGIIRELRVIPGDVALGGSITWEPDLQQYEVDCSVPGWQSIEARALAIIETEEYGLVAAMPMGMSQVSSVNIEPDLKVGDTVKKGDMLGYFLFGGSDFVIVFQKDANFKLTASKEGNGEYNHLLMGEKIGKFGR